MTDASAVLPQVSETATGVSPTLILMEATATATMVSSTMLATESAVLATTAAPLAALQVRWPAQAAKPMQYALLMALVVASMAFTSTQSLGTVAPATSPASVAMDL